MNFLTYLLPYGLVVNSSRIKFRKIIRNVLPYGLVVLLKRRPARHKFSSEFLQQNYVSDLTEREKWALLSYLLQLEKQQGSIHYLEVGTYAGGTIRFLKERTRSVYFTGIDLFEDFVPAADNTHLWTNYSREQVQQVLGGDRVSLYKGDSARVLAELGLSNKKFDFIFIDGNHTYQATRNDFTYGIKLLNRNGYIAFHNCSPGFSTEDQWYVQADGGPWLLTQELRQQKEYTLEQEADRLRIFKYSGQA
jgi:predicted O-methyltransferase YrrM